MLFPETWYCHTCSQRVSGIGPWCELYWREQAKRCVALRLNRKQADEQVDTPPCAKCGSTRWCEHGNYDIRARPGSTN